MKQRSIAVKDKKVTWVAKEEQKRESQRNKLKVKLRKEIRCVSQASKVSERRDL